MRQNVINFTKFSGFHAAGVPEFGLLTLDGCPPGKSGRITEFNDILVNYGPKGLRRAAPGPNDG